MDFTTWDARTGLTEIARWLADARVSAAQGDWAKARMLVGRARSEIERAAKAHDEMAREDG